MARQLHVQLNPAADSEQAQKSGRLPVGISGGIGAEYAPREQRRFLRHFADELRETPRLSAGS